MAWSGVPIFEQEGGGVMQRFGYLSRAANIRRCTIAMLAVAALSGCDKPSDSKTFVENGLNGSQFDEELVPLKIGDTYLAIPRNYIDSFENKGKDGPFIKTASILLFAHWPTMKGRTPENRDEIYSVESQNGYHSVNMHIMHMGSHKYPDDDDQFEFAYRGRTVGYPGQKEPYGSVVRDGNAYGYERYIRRNNWRIAFSHGPTALILRKTDRRGRITSYVYCDSHEIQKSKNYNGFFIRDVTCTYIIVALK